MPNANQSMDDYRGEHLSFSMFGATGDPTADHTSVLTSVLASPQIADGTTIELTAPLRFTSPIVWNKRINIVCRGLNAYFLADLGGTTQDAFTIGSEAGHIQDARFDLVIVGPANCCRNALVLHHLHRSDVRATVRAGASQYGLAVRGCLINNVEINVSGNYAVPYVSAGTPADGILLDWDDSHAIAPNANRFDVCLEGLRHGIVSTDLGNEGNNDICGVIEGMSGRPLNLTAAMGATLHDLHLEAVGSPALFTNCQALKIGPSFFPHGHASLVNCRACQIDGLQGNLTIDSACVGTQVGSLIGNGTTVSNAAPSTIFEQPVPVTAAVDVADAGINSGGNFGENIFPNPYLDIWPAGYSAAPLNFGGSNATWAKEASVVYSGCPSGLSAKLTNTTGALAQGGEAQLPTAYNTQSRDRWMSCSVTVFIPSGQPDFHMYAVSEGQYKDLLVESGSVTTKNQWVTVCGSWRVNSGAACPALLFRFTSGTSVVSGYCYIGGVNIYEGVRPTQHLIDSGKRRDSVVGRIDHTPAFQGQLAYPGYDSTLGRYVSYVAANTRSAKDWRRLSEPCGDVRAGDDSARFTIDAHVDASNSLDEYYVKGSIVDKILRLWGDGTAEAPIRFKAAAIKAYYAFTSDPAPNSITADDDSWYFGFFSGVSAAPGSYGPCLGYKNSQNGYQYSFQVFHAPSGNSIYVRTATSATTWSAWLDLTTASLPNVGTAGTYTKVTTDAQGRVLSGTTLADSDVPTNSRPISTQSGDLGPSGANTRALNTVYQNTTGKPKWVSVNCGIPAGVVSLNGLTDGSNPPTTAVAQQGNYGTSTNAVQVIFPVLNGNYYKVAAPGGSGNPVWFEWN